MDNEGFKDTLFVLAGHLSEHSRPDTELTHAGKAHMKLQPR